MTELVESHRVHTVSSRAVDQGVVVAGSTGTVEFGVDSVAPVTVVRSTPTSGRGTTASPVSLQFAANDATSGVAFVQYRIDNGSWLRVTPGATVAIGTPGSHLVAYRAVDRAGVVEATRSVAVRITG